MAMSEVPFRWVQAEINRMRVDRYSTGEIAVVTGESPDVIDAVIHHQRKYRDGKRFYRWYGEQKASRVKLVRCPVCRCNQSVYIPGHPCRVCDREIELIEQYFEHENEQGGSGEQTADCESANCGGPPPAVPECGQHDAREDGVQRPSSCVA